VPGAHAPARSPTEPSRQARLRAAESLIRIVDAKDHYTGQHSQSVSRLVEAIGRTMQLDDDVLDQLRLAGCPRTSADRHADSILQKPASSRLRRRRSARTRRAGLTGCRSLRWLAGRRVESQSPRGLDRQRYPHRPGRRRHPARLAIILVADAFDAMISERAYRRGGSVEAAIAELRRCSWTQFDARVWPRSNAISPSSPDVAATPDGPPWASSRLDRGIRCGPTRPHSRPRAYAAPPLFIAALALQVIA